MQEMLTDRKPIKSASERVEEKRREAITFEVKGSLGQSCVSMENKEGLNHLHVT